MTKTIANEPNLANLILGYAESTHEQMAMLATVVKVLRIKDSGKFYTEDTLPWEPLEGELATDTFDRIIKDAGLEDWLCIAPVNPAGFPLTNVPKSWPRRPVEVVRSNSHRGI